MIANTCMSKDTEEIGNKKLLESSKAAFLAPSRICTMSVLKCYDWAQTMSRENRCVISGFSSRLEKEMLHFLLKGNSPIVMVLGRKMYTKFPKELILPLKQGQLLIISVTNEVRQSKQSAYKRNLYIADVADEVVFPCIPSKDSSLYSIYEDLKIKNKRIKVILA